MRGDKLDKILNKLMFRIEQKQQELEYYMKRLDLADRAYKVVRSEHEQFYLEKIRTTYRELLDLQDKYNLIALGVYDAHCKPGGEIELIQPKYIQVRLKDE